MMWWWQWWCILIIHNITNYSFVQRKIWRQDYYSTVHSCKWSRMWRPLWCAHQGISLWNFHIHLFINCACNKFPFFDKICCQNSPQIIVIIKYFSLGNKSFNTSIRGCLFVTRLVRAQAWWAHAVTEIIGIKASWEPHFFKHTVVFFMFHYKFFIWADHIVDPH